jgi:hypothetical protein
VDDAASFDQDILVRQDLSGTHVDDVHVLDQEHGGSRGVLGAKLEGQGSNAADERENQPQSSHDNLLNILWVSMAKSAILGAQKVNGCQKVKCILADLARDAPINKDGGPVEFGSGLAGVGRFAKACGESKDSVGVGPKRSAGSRNSSCGGEVSRARSLGARLVSSYAARTFFWSFRYDDTSL